MAIRRANKADSKEIHFILNNTMELRDYGGIEEYPSRWVNAIIKDKKNNLILVNNNKNEMRGFLIAHLLNSIKDAILNHLFVKEKYRNKGVAKELMKEYESYLIKNKFYFNLLFANKNNVSAKQFFESRGFKRGEDFSMYYKEMNN